LQPVRAGFFVRERDGSIHSESTYCEFQLGSEAPLSVKEPPAPAVLARDVPASIVLQTRPVVARTRITRKHLAIASGLLISFVGVLAIAVLAIAMMPKGPAPRAAAPVIPVTLRLSGSSDNILIEWARPGAEEVGQASRGVLDIYDGRAGKVTIPLDKDSLAKGSVTYVRNSANVEVRLRLYGPDSVVSETVSHYVKPLTPPQVTEVEHVVPLDDVVPPPVPEAPPAGERARSAEQIRAAVLPSPASNAATPIPDLAKASAIAGQAPHIASSVPLNSVVTRMPPPHIPPPRQPASGRTIWTGELRRGGVLMIGDGRPSTGALNGRLPAGPIRISAHPAELIDGGMVVYTTAAEQSLSEPPSARNGWNPTIYRNDTKRVRDIDTVEAPSEKNNWRLVLRGNSRTLGLIVLDWQELAPAK
jgi:hypothetical protein